MRTEARIGTRGESKRRWDRMNRGVCECGLPKERGAELCMTCHRERVSQETQERRRMIQFLWKAGERAEDIATMVGYSSRGSLRQEIIRMRRLGWDMPHRRSGRPRKVST